LASLGLLAARSFGEAIESCFGDLMLEYAGSQRGGVRKQREAPGLLSIARSVDWVLFLGIAALVAVGLWGAAGVTKFAIPNDPSYYLNRQILYAGVGGVALVAVALIDPDLYRRYWRAIFIATAVLIAFVLLVGHAAHGSTRWISLGFFTFQPSEFGKLLFVIALAGMLAERRREMGSFGTTLRVVGLGLFPVLLVFAQPDLGTALVYSAALAGMLFVAGVPWRHLAVLGGLVVFVLAGVLWAAPAAGVNVLKSYQQQRLTCFTHPSTCTDAAGYNLDQSITAVGSGGIRGQGPNGSSQVNLGFLPESGTDFVFAGFAEQRGFIGAALLLGLYLLVLWRGLRVITVARDLFSAVVAGGIVVALLFQIFVNVGMTMGIAPITGIPLPFVSVGGSSLISNLAAMGVLLAIHARSRVSRRH
jgi:rod shape determining protein RodA